MASEVKLRLALEGAREVSEGLGATARAATSATEGLGRTANQMDRAGMSAKALAAATRGLGPQFTDIFTSLASGQAPMTVLLQQGGQLKDMFGGVGPAAQAMGGYIAGLVTPHTLAAAAVGALGYAYYRGSAEADGYTRSIVMSGNAAGMTAGKLYEMAARLDGTVGTHYQAAQALATFTGTGRVAGAEIERYTAIALRAERDIGQSVEDTAKHFADLAKDPVGASLKLTDALGYLTTATFSQIRVAKAMGDEDRAAAIAQEAYAAAMDTRSSQMAGSLGTIERGWRSLKAAAAEAWDSMLGIGRANTIGQQLTAVGAEISRARGQDPNRRHQMPWDDSLETLLQRQAYLQEMARLEQRGAAAAAERMANERAGLEAVKAVAAANAKALTKQEQMNKALAEYRRGLEDIRRVDPNNVLLNPKTVARTEASIREQFKPGKAGTPGDAFAAEREAARQWADAIKDADTAALAATASADGLGRSQQRLLQYLQSPAYANNTEEMRQTALQHLYAAVAAEEHATAQKSAAKAIEEARKSHEDLVGSLEKSADSTEAYALQLEAEEQAVGVARTANLSLAVALQHVAIARLREKQAAMLGNEDAVLAIQREIDARERLIVLIGSKEVRESNQKAAKDAAKAWDDSVEQVSKGLADALLRGGKSGRQYIEDQLRRPFSIMIQAMVQPTIAGIGGWLGLPGSGSPFGSAPGAGSGMAGLGMLGTSSIGMGFSGAWGAGGGLMSTLTAGASLLGSGAIGSGLGVMAGALGPLALGAMLLSGLDDSGTLHTGAAASSDGTRARSISAPSLGTQGIVTSRQSQTAMNQIATGGAGALNATAKAFGLQGGYTVSTAYADDSSDDGAWGAMSISRAGQVRQDWRDGQTSRWAPRVFSDGQAGQQEYEGAVADTLLAELNAMGLPDWAMGILEDLGDAPEMQDLVEAVSQINELQTVLGALGQSMVDFSAFSEEALISLVSATGGGAALLGQLSSYEAKYYTTAEKRAALEAQVGSELAKVNLQMPRTRQEYRAMMDAALAMGDAGAPTVQVLLANADAFATLTPEIEEATEAVKRSAADIARERDGLQRRYLQLMGDTQALRQLELAQLDESNRALQQQIWAEEDRQATVAAATKAQEDYNRALQSASSFLDGVTRSIRDFVKGGVGSTALADDPATAMSVYRDQYRRAAAGDRDALQSITTAAGRVVSAAEQRMSASDGRRLIAQVSEELLALPGMLTAEQLIVDAVGSGAAQTTAAVQLLPEQLDATIGARLSAGFDRIDANSDRQISRAEFLSAFGLLGTEQTLNSIFAKLDTNGDGQLSELEAIRNNALVSNDWLAIIRGDLAHIANLVFDLHYYQRHDLAHLTNVMQAGLTVRSEYRAGALQTFAVGGAFGPGGVVQRPVAFPLGLMGEAGPEAILPLTRIGGTLGVRAVGGASSSDRLEPLLRELVAETARQGYELRAVVTSNNAIARRMREIELTGVMVRPAPDEPLAVEAV